MKYTLYTCLLTTVLSASSGFRKRRSTGQEPSSTSSFVVGKDGDCAGTSSNEYCNGQLQPGRSYRYNPKFQLHFKFHFNH